MIIMGLLDNENILVDDNTVLIEQFLNDNYNINGSYIIKNNTVDVYGCIQVKMNASAALRSLTNGLFKFGRITHSFYCMQCNLIKNLKGAPKEVGGDFNCAGCWKLKTLKWSPKEVGGGFDCSQCFSLTSLKGCPKKVRNSFNCKQCNHLLTLKGCPQYVGGNFDCSQCNSLINYSELDKICIKCEIIKY